MDEEERRKDIKQKMTALDRFVTSTRRLIQGEIANLQGVDLDILKNNYRRDRTLLIKKMGYRLLYAGMGGLPRWKEIE